MAVVLVAADDVLNVRSAPGTKGEIVHALAASADDVAVTANVEMQGNQRWVQVRVGAKLGWVNAHFLASNTPLTTEQLAARFDAAIDTAADELSVSKRGLFVAVGETVTRFDKSKLSEADIYVPGLDRLGECPKVGQLGLSLLQPMLRDYANLRSSPTRAVAPVTELRNFSCAGFGETPRWVLCFDPDDDGRLIGLARTSSAVVSREVLVHAPPPRSSTTASRRLDVVFVAPGAALSAHERPDVRAQVIHRFDGGDKEVETTSTRDGAWVQVRTPSGLAWVESRFTTEHVPRSTFESDARVVALVSEFGRRVRTRSDLSPIASSRGLSVHRFGSVRMIAPAALATVLTDEVRRPVNGPACGEACESLTDRELIGAAFLDAYYDPDRKTAFGQWLAGGNRSATLPALLRNFRHVTYYDEGDEPCLGLDWRTSALFFEYEGGVPTIVAISEDAWSP